jgi:hypothetical protein
MKIELDIELDIITWCLISILDKEYILNIKTWYYISILAYIYIVLLTVREY